jgi:hypothetical protein
VTALSLDANKSTIRIHTFAEGLFARLAHDIEIVLTELTGSADRAAGQASVEARLGGAEVAGVLAGGRVDAGVLSAGDRRDILDKMRREVFHAGPSEVVRVEAALDGATAKAKLSTPNGRSVGVRFRADVRDGDGPPGGEAGETRVSGSFEVSLASIGSDVVKGPMNAFRVKDRVVVRLELVFRPA